MKKKIKLDRQPKGKKNKELILKKKSLQIINAGEGVNKGNPPTLLVGM